MFACYYCQQIPTSPTADAHYNCKRGLARSALLRVADVISECIGMCIRKCLDSTTSLSSKVVHPSTSLTLFYSDDARLVWRNRRIKRGTGEGNLIFSSSEKTLSKSIKDEPRRELTYTTERPRVVSYNPISIEIEWID